MVIGHWKSVNIGHVFDSGEFNTVLDKSKKYEPGYPLQVIKEVTKIEYDQCLRDSGLDERSIRETDYGAGPYFYLVSAD